MKKGKINTLFIYICLICTGFPGCKTIRKSIDLTNGINEKSIKENIKKSKIDVKTIWIKKYDCEIRENWKRTDFYGDIKIVKGERITITIKGGIGIETARVLLTKDSVKIVDRMKKKVFCGGYKQMKRYSGLIDCYKKTEDLIISNNSMVIEELEKNTGKKYDIIPGEKSNEIIICKTGIKKREKCFTIGMANSNVSEYMEKRGEKEMLKIAYLNWKDVEKIKFPQELKIEINRNNGKTKAIIKYEKVEINKEINTKFKIPVGYKIINL